jgi:hypothetical protein
MTVSEMAEILGHPAWLEREQVVVFWVIGGYVPLNVTLGQTAILLNLGTTPPARIWFAIQGRITPDDLHELHALLTGTASAETINSKGTIKVTDFTIETSDR